MLLVIEFKIRILSVQKVIIFSILYFFLFITILVFHNYYIDILSLISKKSPHIATVLVTSYCDYKSNAI